jgi:hypothetical protein
MRFLHVRVAQMQRPAVSPAMMFEVTREMPIKIHHF